MSFLSSFVRQKHDLHFARVCWALAAVCGLLSFALLVFAPDVSVLHLPDGMTFLYIDRQFDLPTGDESVFRDYSLLPHCAGIAGCAAFYLLTRAFFWGRHANVSEATAG
jgi:hypothetical protein